MSGSGGWCSGNPQNKKYFSCRNEKTVISFFRKISKFSKILLENIKLTLQKPLSPIKISNFFENFRKNKITVFSFLQEKHFLFCGFPSSQLEIPNMCDRFFTKTPSLTFTDENTYCRGYRIIKPDWLVNSLASSLAL